MSINEFAISPPGPSIYREPERSFVVRATRQFFGATPGEAQEKAQRWAEGQGAQTETDNPAVLDALARTLFER